MIIWCVCTVSAKVNHLGLQHEHRSELEIINNNRCNVWIRHLQPAGAFSLVNFMVD